MRRVFIFLLLVSPLAWATEPLSPMAKRRAEVIRAMQVALAECTEEVQKQLTPGVEIVITAEPIRDLYFQFFSTVFIGNSVSASYALNSLDIDFFLGQSNDDLNWAMSIMKSFLRHSASGIPHLFAMHPEIVNPQYQPRKTLPFFHHFDPKQLEEYLVHPSNFFSHINRDRTYRGVLKWLASLGATEMELVKVTSISDKEMSFRNQYDRFPVSAERIVLIVPSGESIIVDVPWFQDEREKNVHGAREMSDRLLLALKFLNALDVYAKTDPVGKAKLRLDVVEWDRVYQRDRAYRPKPLTYPPLQFLRRPCGYLPSLLVNRPQMVFQFPLN